MVQRNKSWFQPKSYLHLTKPITFKDYNIVKGYVSCPNMVKKRAFFPLIHRVQLQKRYKKLNDGTRSHINEKGESTAKPRKIYYASHFDSQVYSYYAKEILGKLYEKLLLDEPKLSKCISAYRFIETYPNSQRGKSNIHFAKEVFDFIKEQRNCVALLFDIEKFFDSLDHTHLKKCWCDLLQKSQLPDDHYNIYKSITDFSFVYENALSKTLGLEKFNDSKERQKYCREKNIKSYCIDNKDFKRRIKLPLHHKEKIVIHSHPFKNEDGNRQGIPQGTPISAFLANLYMLDFDREVNEKISSPNINGLYRRYSDDIIIICPIGNENEIMQWISSLIKCKFRLTINAEKTEKVIFQNQKSTYKNSLRYLGFEFDGENTLLKSASLAKYFRKMKMLIKSKALKSYVLQKAKKTIHTQIFRKHIYKKYSHLGKQNYISYSYRSSKILRSIKIRQQLSRHWKQIHTYMDKWEKKLNLPKR
jgi:Reverse transcriptase (RNA-dependent DNA polymerase)